MTTDKLVESNQNITDLALASYLLTEGCELTGITRDGRGGKVFFVFAKDDRMDNLIMAFYNRHAKVDPLTFAETLRNLKALIHQGG